MMMMIEALTKRVAKLERQVKELKNVKPPRETSARTTNR